MSASPASMNSMFVACHSSSSVHSSVGASPPSLAAAIPGISRSDTSTPSSLSSGASGSSGSSAKNKQKQKPANVFSNDGSFLERFQRIQQEDEEKKKQEEALERKRQFENRFKNRGKRRAPSTEADSACATPEDDALVKRAKVDDTGNESLTAYEKQVKNYTPDSSKDVGTGIRPLVK